MSIEIYKQRFYKLLESEMGDVKPLITEQPATTQKPTTTQQQVASQKPTTTQQQVASQKPTTQQPATTQQQVASQEPTTQQPLTKAYTVKDWDKENVGLNFKPKEQPKPTAIKNLPNITKGNTPGTLKLCPQIGPNGENSPYQCIEREVKVCYGKFCLKLIIDLAKIRPEDGDLYAVVRPNSKFLQNFLNVLPKKFTESFLSQNGSIQFQGDAKSVNYAVEQLKQGGRNIKIPIGFGVYALIV